VLHPTIRTSSSTTSEVGNLKRLFADQYRDTPVTVMASNKPSQ